MRIRFSDKVYKIIKLLKIKKITSVRKAYSKQNIISQQNYDTKFSKTGYVSEFKDQFDYSVEFQKNFEFDSQDIINVFSKNASGIFK